MMKHRLTQLAFWTSMVFLLMIFGCKEDITFIPDPTTTISFDLPYHSLVTFTIYDVVGSEVVTLLDHAERAAGTNEEPFDITSLASGVYYARIIAQELNDNGTPTGVMYISDKKMCLIK